MTASPSGRIAPQSLTENDARRLQLANKVRVIQAAATRGRGMKRKDLDAALEDVVKGIKEL